MVDDTTGCYSHEFLSSIHIHSFDIPVKHGKKGGENEDEGWLSSALFALLCFLVFALFVYSVTDAPKTSIN